MARDETTGAQLRQFVVAAGDKMQDRCWTFDHQESITLTTIAWDAPTHAATDDHPALCAT
ncbi:hypothetical protein [Xanthomonas prunicola]|uniref:hypothetical protein n=1 Tax=Xanthomonas prunicola TaxID=2053930 RepID=UPI00138FEA60|nr:hypothetical protein [Xanthomonas prunicola]